MNRDRRRAYYQAPPGEPQHSFEWFEECAIPQSLQFMIDCLPAIRDLLKEPGLQEPLTVLDVGTRSGAGANLLATLHRTHMIGPSLIVDALDIAPEFKIYAEEFFPDVREYIVGDIFQVERNRKWDLVICSHTIEHLANPRPFIEELNRRARKWLLLYAPFEERQPDGVEHLTRITRGFVESFEPIRVDVFSSPGWQKPGEPDSKVVLFVLPGAEILRPPHAVAHVRAKADALWAKGDFRGAVQLLEPVVKRNPRNAHMQYCLALSLALCARYGDAVPHYDQALEGGFDEYWVRYNRGQSLANVGRQREAIADLERAAELNESDAGLKEMLERLRGAAV